MKTSRPTKNVSRPKPPRSRTKPPRSSRPSWPTVEAAVTALREQTLIVEKLNDQCLRMAAGGGGTEDGAGFYRLLVETCDAARRARELSRALDNALAGRNAGQAH